MLLKQLLCTLLLSACAGQSPGLPDALRHPATPAEIPANTQVSFSFRPMAFDGQLLWQIVRETGRFRLVAQNLLGRTIKEVPLANPNLPVHRSLAWGRNSFWLLDQSNTIHRIDTEGKVLSKFRPEELQAPGGLEQLVWHQDQLWVLHRAYLAADGSTTPARFYRLDPDSVQILERLEIKDTAFNFAHTNLAADDKAFYVLRGHIFDQKSNLAYRVDRTDGKITTKELGRIHTGMTAAFLFQQTLIGVEMLDIDNCGELCRGQLVKLTPP